MLHYNSLRALNTPIALSMTKKLHIIYISGLYLLTKESK